MRSDFEQFSSIREKMYDLSKLEKQRNQLLSDIREQEKLIVQLEVTLDMEQEDVEKLTRMSLSNLFYTILGSKNEQLEIERRQALEAALKLQEAKQSLQEYRDELGIIQLRIADLSTAPAQYAELMREKEALLRLMPLTALELEEMEQEISDCSLLLKELKEALSAGRGVLSLLSDASDSLGKAENWGNWDMWMNGGLISTHMKHSHVDDARNFIHSANTQLNTFQKELADLNRAVHTSFDISDILKLADYWFDGLIVDWIVQGKIKNAQDQVLNALHNIRPVVTALETEASVTEQRLEGLKQQRLSWIEQAEHG